MCNLAPTFPTIFLSHDSDRYIIFKISKEEGTLYLLSSEMHYYWLCNKQLVYTYVYGRLLVALRKMCSLDFWRNFHVNAAKARFTSTVYVQNFNKQVLYLKSQSSSRFFRKSWPKQKRMKHINWRKRTFITWLNIPNITKMKLSEFLCSNIIYRNVFFSSF